MHCRSHVFFQEKFITSHGLQGEKMFKPTLLLSQLLLPVVTMMLIGASPVAAQVWTLEKSTQRAMNGSLEQQEAVAGIAVRESELQQAGAWPNPTVSLRAQNRLGLDDGAGGYNLDQFTISQPLPFWRLQQQQDVAKKQLSAEEASADQLLLNMQSEIARLYYALQFNHEKLLLAEKRQKFTAAIVDSYSQKSSQVIRYINPLDRHRIELLDEAAHRDLFTARAAYSETVHLFRLRLQLTKQEEIKLPVMTAAIAPQALSALQQQLEASSASMKQMQYQVEVGEGNAALERARRFNDPVLSLIHERDILAGRRQNFQGVMLSMTVPLWDGNEGNIARAEAETMRSESRLQITRRNHLAQLEQNHLQLTHLLKQFRTFDKQMIEPAEHLLKLTRQSYAVGEVNSLSLIDAYNSYFNALTSKLNLMYQSNLAATNLYQTLGDLSVYTAKTEVQQ